MKSRFQNIYSRISSSYEFINTLLTFGLDSRWRKKAALLAIELSPGNDNFLDICSGTGQTARNINRLMLKQNNRPGHVVSADFSPHMLTLAAQKKEKKQLTGISFTLGDAQKLPFKDNTFDAITISFATRNLDSQQGMEKAFTEFHRVLKPGGVFINLETSQPASKIIRIPFHLFVKLTVWPIGKLFSGSGEDYAYLSSSIRQFYPPGELSGILKESGFSAVTFKRLLLGGVAVHIATK